MNAKNIIIERWKSLRKDTRTATISRQLEKRIVQYSKSTSHILVIANTQVGRGEIAAAIESLQAGLSRFPGNVKLKYRCAFLLEKCGRLSEARDLYLDLVDDCSGNPQAPYRLAVTLQRLGKSEEALSWALNYCARFPSDARASWLAYDLASSEPLWRRYEILSSAVGELETDVEWQSQAIALAYNMRRYEDCVNRYRTVRGDVKRRTLAQVVASLMQLDQVEEAWNTASQFLTRTASKGSQRFPGALMQELGAWNFARVLHELSYQKCPTAQLAYLVGFASSRTFDWRDAADWYRAALPGSANEKQIRYYLGIALERQERWLEAAREYLRAATSNSATDYRIYRAISCLNAANDTKAAANLFDKLEWDKPKLDVINLEGLAPYQPNTDLHRLFKEALRKQRTSALEYVVDEAIVAQQWDLAIEASNALADRSWTHMQHYHLLRARAFAGGGKPKNAVRAFLDSRLYRDASVVDQSRYENKRLDKLSMRYGSFLTHGELNPNTVLYESNHGSKITCNVLPLLRAIVDDDRFEGYTHYVVAPDRTFLPDDLCNRPNVVVMPRDSDLYLKKLATAGWVINNNTFPAYYTRREGQKYLNLWHGTPIKSMGRDIKNGNFDYRNASRNLLHVTHLALPNAHTRDQLLERYGVSNLHQAQVELTGSPRLDVTLNLVGNRREHIRNRLGLGADDKAVLYAPTWRGELGRVEDDGEVVADVLRRIQASGYRALYRGHPVSSSDANDELLSRLAVPEDLDTNELLACVDAVVSDYSSIVFDAAISGVPVGLFAYDEGDYDEHRGFSLKLRDLKMPVLQDVNELSHWLNTLDLRSSVDIPDIFSGREDGKATDRVLTLMTKTDSEVACSASQNTILLFEGHFIPNGITSSAKQLNAVLRRNGSNVVIAIEPGAVTSFEERADAFRTSVFDCDILPRIAGSIDTAEQRWLISRQHQGQFLSEPQLDSVHEAYKKEFHRLYGSAKFDVVVGFEGFSLYWSNLMSAASAKRKVCFLHANMTEEATSRFPYLWKVFETYKHFDALASVSPDATEVNQWNLGKWADGQQFVTAENIIDIEQIRLQSTAGASNEYEEFIKQHTYNFVAVGRLSIEKGSDRLVEAFLDVASTNTDVGLVVIGDGPLRLQLERRVQFEGLADQVYFAGRLSNPFAYMGACDTLVMASHHEGQGIVVLEALALGLNVVSVDIPGPRSLIKDQIGLLVENSTSGLIDGLRVMIEERHTFREFDVEAYSRNAAEQTVDVITGQKTVAWTKATSKGAK